MDAKYVEDACRDDRAADALGGFGAGDCKRALEIRAHPGERARVVSPFDERLG